MKTDLRKSGIEIIGDVPWGTHFCQFYQSREDLIEVLVPYFKQGLENNEFCMWVTSELLGIEDAKAALKVKVKDLDAYVKKGQIEILDYSQWYTKTGEFNADKVLEGWVKKEEQAIERGFDGLRLTGNTFWLEKKDWESFVNHEAIVNSAIGKHRILAICSYSLDKCRAGEVIDVVNNHQFAFINKEGKWRLMQSSDRTKMEEELREVKEVKDAFELSSASFHAIVEKSPEGIIVVDHKGFVRYANTAAEVILERKKEDFVGDMFGVPAGYGITEVDIVRSGDGHGIGEMRTIATTWEDEPAYLVSIYDITERKRAEEALRSSENKYRTLLENLPQKIFLKDRNSVYISCNENYSGDLKIRAQDIAGKTDYDFYPKELADKYRADDKRIMEEDKTEEFEEEYLQEGEKRWVHTVKTPVKDPHGNLIGILGIFWDVTERRQAEHKLLEYQKQLKRLAAQLALAEERERRRIAGELHDQVAQSLALAKIKLDTVHAAVSYQPLAQALEDVSSSLEKAIQDTKSLTFDLSNPILYELGFEAAVAEWLDGQVRDKHGIATEFEDDGQPKPLDDDVRMLLFRNIRELLINCIKHAHADKVVVRVRRIDGSIEVVVEDNGIGFDPTEVKSMAVRRSEFGLLSIREGLEEMGGRFEIESKPGAGCKAIMTAPLKQKGDN